jgi:two-component system heavy metal sensor histidine kinase CusS
MRFRSRLVGAVTGVTVVTLGGAFAVVGHLVNRDQQRQLDAALLAEAHQEALEAAQAGGGAQLQIKDGPGPMANDIGPLTKYGAIFAPDRRVLSSTDTFYGHVPPFAQLEHAPDECFDLWFHREHLRAMLTPVPGHPGSLLMLAAPRLDLDSDAAFLRRAMIDVFVVALAYAVLIATFIVRRLTRGHAAVAHVASRVADGDLSARVLPDASDPEMAQLGQDVNHMIERLSHLLRAQEDFITHAAHELRSPLTSLYGELAHALRRARDETSYRRSIEEALESAQRLKELADSLLTLSRIGSAAEEPLTTVRLGDVLERARRAVSGEAAAHDVAIELDDEVYFVSGHSQDLERLFCNLLENAIRHSPPQGSVRIRFSDDGERIAVHVVDQGAGVPDGDREHIFEPFYRGSAAYGTPGYGLGLSIARKIARAHGGDLTLGSATNGAEFIVQLPQV